MAGRPSSRSRDPALKALAAAAVLLTALAAAQASLLIWGVPALAWVLLRVGGSVVAREIVLARRGAALLGAGKPREAEEALRAALELDSNSPARLDLARAELEQGRLRDAFAACRAHLDRYPDDGAAYLLEDDIARRLGLPIGERRARLKAGLGALRQALREREALTGPAEPLSGVKNARVVGRLAREAAEIGRRLRSR